MATATGSVVSFEMSDGNTGKQHAILGYSTTTANDKVTIKLTSGKLGRDKGMAITSSFWSWTLSGTGQTSVSGTPSAASYGTSDVTCFSADKTWTWDRGTSKATKTVKFATKYTKVSGQSASTATVTVTIPALASYTVTYNNNGGSGTHASQTKYYGKSLTLTTGTHPTRTGYTFNGWNTKADGTGTPYSSSNVAYTANAALTLYAQWNENSYSVTYNANGGSGAPATQTRNYTASATIPSTIPTRHLYKFTGWNTASGGTGTTYQPGGTIPANTAANVTLYAQWTLNYTKPVISSSSAMRTNSSGQAVDDDSGTYASISCTWAVDTLPDEGGTNTGTLTATRVDPDSTVSTVTLSGDTTGSGGTATAMLSGLDVDSAYTVIFSLTDGENITVLATLGVPKQLFQLDFSPAGGVGIGTAAPDERSCVVALKPYFGEYPAKDTSDDYLLIVGNGTADNARSNAATISRDGDLYLANGGQKVLWSGGAYMNASQTITLSEPISEQAFGIVLHWCAYSNGAVQDFDHYYQYVPKQHIVSHGGKGISCLLTSSNGNAVGHKYVYVSDTSIQGNANNQGTNTSSGITYNNSYWVLFQVIGV